MFMKLLLGVGATSLLFTVMGCRSSTELAWNSAVTAMSPEDYNDKMPLEWRRMSPIQLKGKDAQSGITWVFRGTSLAVGHELKTMEIPRCESCNISILYSGKDGQTNPLVFYVLVTVRFSSPDGVEWLIERLNEITDPIFFWRESDSEVSLLLCSSQ